MKKEYKDKIIIIGSGVVGIHAATKLIDGGYPGELITIIDAGKDPYTRPDTELMKGFAGCGMKSDGKYTRSIYVGGQLAKYCGEEKAYQLMDETIEMLKRFHPEPDKIIKSEPTEEPDFIKPYFNLRLFPCWHVGTDYLDITAKNWYNWLVEKGVKFCFDTEIIDIDFSLQRVISNSKFINVKISFKEDPKKLKENLKKFGIDMDKEIEYIKQLEEYSIQYDKLIYATGKSGIDFTQKLIEKYSLPKEEKSTQIGVRFEAPQKYFQKLIDQAYDFKLYQKPNDKVSLRTFCTNNDKAYVAVEETYGDISYNGHAKKSEEFRNNMTNFGIIMEIKGIKDPFEWARNLVSKLQKEVTIKNDEDKTIDYYKAGIYYSPNRQAANTAEGTRIKCFQIDSLDLFKEVYGEYADYIINFINDLNKTFQFGDDYGIYIPEIKYLSEEVLTNHEDLSLINYPNIYFAGDSLSARGIVVSACHGLYIAEALLK